MHSNHLSSKYGFTLIEISIVLIIIGLILVGVLKGKEMIDNSKINNIKKEVDSIVSAIYSYQDRYQYLPGDDALASTRFGITVGDGNGDGIISGNWNSTDSTDESILLWQHLNASNLVTSQSTHAFGGQYGYENAIQGMAGDILCFSGIKGSIASIMDSKYDDGDGTSGNIRNDGSSRTETTPDGDFELSSVTQCFKN